MLVHCRAAKAGFPVIAYKPSTNHVALISKICRVSDPAVLDVAKYDAARLEHVLGPASQLEKMRDLLKLGGVLRFSVPGLFAVRSHHG